MNGGSEDCAVCGLECGADYYVQGLWLCDTCLSVDLEFSPHVLESRAAALSTADGDDYERDGLRTLAGWLRAIEGAPRQRR
ncbi:MAG: hypothetical protein H6816_16390 [Phycisphaerales bacterium]|nr:hypothetical protein [Phycisphaerales bacterium]